MTQESKQVCELKQQLRTEREKVRQLCKLLSAQSNDISQLPYGPRVDEEL